MWRPQPWYCWFALAFSVLVVIVEHDQMGADGLGTTRRLLAADAALALAGLSVSVLEALGSSVAALLAVWCGAGFAVGMHAFGADPLPGGRIFSGAIVTVVLSVPALAALLTHPEHRIVAAT